MYWLLLNERSTRRESASDLRVLFVEDSEDDVLLLREPLASFAPRVQRVDTRLPSAPRC
jgi:hypothetical protein